MKIYRRSSYVLGVLLLPVGICQAQYTLTSGNSSVTVDANGSTISSWSVEQQNQLNQQSFWYRIGNSGSALSLGSASLDLYTGSLLETTYANSLFSVTILYSLVGGTTGSGASDLSEQISINNISGSKLNLDFFQYADFNLGGTPNNDTGKLDKNGSKFGGVTQYNSPGCMVNENVDTAVSQSASYGQIGIGNTILNELASNSFSHLNNQNGSMTGGANVNWGLEWDANIAAGGTYIISKDLNIVGVVPVGPVPEPSTWSLALLGALSCGLFKHRLSRRNA